MCLHLHPPHCRRFCCHTITLYYRAEPHRFCLSTLSVLSGPENAVRAFSSRDSVITLFTFSLTSLYMFAVFFGKRKAGYILYGSRNWRGSRPEPGVPGLHTRSPSLQGVL